MPVLTPSSTQLSRFGHMTSSFQAQDAYRVLRILCKHFGKFPGQTLPLRWLALEWRSGSPSDMGAGSERWHITEHDLQTAIEYAIQSGWLIRHAGRDESVIELTQAGYQRHNDREAISTSGKNAPRDLLKLLKKRD